MKKKQTSNTLILHVKHKWFREIAYGYKKIEYREVKKYWNSRIKNRNYQFLKIVDGYDSTAPVAICDYGGYDIIEYKRLPPEVKEEFGEQEPDKKYYALKITRLFKLDNWDEGA